MPDEVLIKAESLSRSYAGVTAVDRVSFELRRGEVLGFLGPNGAGKSTTLQMICGCLAPGAGRIEIDGIDLLAEPIRAKQRIGYLPEVPPLYPDLKVIEYLRFCARLHRLATPAVGDAVDRVLAACGLDEVRDRLIGHLSKGMQQRAGIAQALVHDPAVVVLDEPTVGLDPIQIRDIRHLVAAIGRERAVVLSSHILPEVEAVCDRVLILHQGRILHDARLDQTTGDWLRLSLRKPPALEALLALPPVREARPDGGSWQVRVEAEPDAAARLLRLAVEAGWEPEACAPTGGELERVFLAITRGEAEADAESATWSA